MLQLGPYGGGEAGGGGGYGAAGPRVEFARGGRVSFGVGSPLAVPVPPQACSCEAVPALREQLLRLGKAGRRPAGSWWYRAGAAADGRAAGVSALCEGWLPGCLGAWGLTKAEVIAARSNSVGSGQRVPGTGE